MVKIFGPLFSSEARGTIAKSINLQISRGIAVVRKYFKPTYRRTEAQDEVRNLFKEALESWGSQNPRVKYAWKLFVLNKPRTARCAFLHQYLESKGPSWDLYPWVPPYPVQPTIWPCYRHADRSGDDIYIRFNTFLVKDYPQLAYKYPTRLWPIGPRTMEAGIDLYHSDVKDIEDPSFEYLMSFVGGKTFFNFTHPAKEFIAINIFDMHGKPIPYTWLNDWPGWE